MPQPAIAAALRPVLYPVAAKAGTFPALVLVDSPPEARVRWWHPSGILADVGLCLAIGVLFPFAILAVGTPIALVVLALIEVINRL